MKNHEIERLAAGMLMIGFSDTDSPEFADLVQRGVRNFVLFRRNALSRDQIIETTGTLRTIAGEDAVIAIDHEGGAVNRLRCVAPDWPSQMGVAAAGDPDLARRAAYVSALQLRDLGINLNFAPVADLAVDQRNPVVGTRAYSDDPLLAARYVRASVQGHRQARVGTTAKHFPGHGPTPTDSHVGLPTITRTRGELEARDLIPFKAAVEEGVDCLMTSHVWYTALDGEQVPATLSSSVVDLARHCVGFSGVIVTDCLEMGAIQERMSTGEAAVRAARAGCDLLLISHQQDRQREALDALTQAISCGDLCLSSVQEASARIETLRTRLTNSVRSEEYEEAAGLAGEVAARGVTVLRDRHGILPFDMQRGESLALVTFTASTATLAETIDGSPFVQVVRERVPTVVEVAVTGEQESLDGILDRLRGIDHVMVVTSFATGRPLQGSMVRRLSLERSDFVVIAARDPFDLLEFPEVPCYLATYGDLDAASSQVLDIVFAGGEATGRLPVEIPGLYPRGHGLVRSEVR